MRTRTLLLAIIASVSFSFVACGKPPATRTVETTTFNVPSKPVELYERKLIDKVNWTVPKAIDITKWVPLGRVLSERDAKLLRLHVETLKYGGFYYNELRERRTFEVTYIAEGTPVWVDEFGIPRYLVSCGNLIGRVEPTQNCPYAVTCPLGKFSYIGGEDVQGQPSSTSPSPEATQSSNSLNDGALPATSGDSDQNSNNWDFSWLRNGILGLLALGVLLAIAILIGWALYRLLQALRNNATPPPPAAYAQRPPHFPRPVQPVAPAPAPVPNPEPVPTPAPVPVAPNPTWRRHGPFDRTENTNAGLPGSHLIAYPRNGTPVDLGVVGNTATDDDGPNGHYVWVLEG